MTYKEGYDKGRDAVYNKFGSKSNACAAVVSSILDMELCWTTKELLDKLLILDHKLILYVDKIDPGDILFSCDMVDKYMPDHVCICTHIEGYDFYVVDNYSYIPKRRNMRKGNKTAFGFGVRINNGR